MVKGKKSKKVKETEVNVEDIEDNELDNIFNDNEVIQEDEEIEFSLNINDENIPEIPTENTGFRTSVTQINEIINKITCEISKTAPLLQVTAIEVKENNTMLISAGNEVASRLIKTHIQNNFTTIGSGILTIDWFVLRDEINTFFDPKDIISVIFVPSENIFRLIKDSPKRIRTIPATEYSLQYIIEETDFKIKKNVTYVDDFKLDVIVKINSQEIKDIIRLINRVNEHKFPLILNKKGILILNMGSDDSSFESEFLPVNFKNPYKEKIEAYYRDGFQEIILNSTGRLTLKFNDNAPLMVMEKDKDFDIVSVIQPFETSE